MEMEKTMKTLVTICVLLSVVGVANATYVINFDGLTIGQVDPWGMKYDVIPQNYQNLVWTPYDIVNSWNVNDGGTYRSSQGNSSEPTGLSQFASNSGGQPVTVSAVSGEHFNFEGADFGTWAQNNAFQSLSARNITVEGFDGNASVGSVTVALNIIGYTPLVANFQNITRIDISGGTGMYWRMDNFTTPEPATLAILGLGAMGLLRRKRAA
jgi:hypothetical protein